MENQLPELFIGTIYVAPIIVALIELAKKLGLDTKYAIWVNAGLNVLFYGVMLLTQAQPETEQYVVMGLTALLMFLMGAGVYDVGVKNVIQKVK